MNFWTRLRFYLFGFGLGLILVIAMFGNRSCTTPNEIKVNELRAQYFQLSDKAKCKLRCLRINEFMLRLELRHFKVNYDVSDIHKKPCGDYYLEPKEGHESEYNYKLIVRDCDTISRIEDISLSSAISCTCQ